MAAHETTYGFGELPGMWEEADFTGGPDWNAPDGNPGDWFTAGFDSPCSRGFCKGITKGETIRSDGVEDNSWECQGCVELESEAAASSPETRPEWAQSKGESR